MRTNGTPPPSNEAGGIVGTGSLAEAILEGMTEAVTLFDADHRVVYRNAASHRLYAGTPIENVMGMTIEQIAAKVIAAGERLVVEGRELSAAEWAAFVSNPNGVRYERQIRPGRHVEIQYKPLPDGSLLGVHRDITKRKQEEDETAKARREADRARNDALAARELMAAVLGGMTDGVGLFDGDMRLIFETDSVRSMFGVPSGGWKPAATLREIIEVQQEAGRPLIVEGKPVGVDEAMARIAASESFRAERLLPDGRHVELQFRRAGNGSTIGVMRDITEHKHRQAETEKARDAVAELQRLMMNVLETLIDGVRLYDAETQIIYQNRAIGTVLGTSAYYDEMGLTIEEVFQRRVAEKDVVILRENPEAELRERLAHFHSRDGGAYEVRRTDGRVIDVLIRPVGDGKKLGIFRDITDMRRRQEEIERARDRLQDAQELMNEVLEGMSDGVRLYDADMRLVYENSAVHALYGVLPEGSQVGMTLAEILQAQIDAGIDPVFDGEKLTVAEAVARVTSSEGTHYFRTMPNGREVQFQFRPLHNGRTLCVLRDLTDVHRQQTDLVDAQRLMTAVLDNMTDGVRLFDADERLVYENQAFLRMSGTDPGVEEGMTAEQIFRRRVARGDLVAGTTADQDVAQRLSQFRSDDAGGYELALKNGQTISIRFRPAGAGRRLGVYSDVTEINRRQAELEQARDASAAAQQRLNIVLENMVDGVRLFDADERLVYQNSAAGEIFDNPDAPAELGLTLEEIVRRRIAGGSDADRDGLPLDLAERMRLIRQPLGTRFETSLRSGRRVEIIYRPLDAGGKLAIFRDITELRRRSGEDGH